MCCGKRWRPRQQHTTKAWHCQSGKGVFCEATRERAHPLYGPSVLRLDAVQQSTTADGTEYHMRNGGNIQNTQHLGNAPTPWAISAQWTGGVRKQSNDKWGVCGGGGVLIRRARADGGPVHPQATHKPPSPPPPTGRQFRGGIPWMPPADAWTGPGKEESSERSHGPHSQPTPDSDVLGLGLMQTPMCGPCPLSPPPMSVSSTGSPKKLRKPPHCSRPLRLLASNIR